MFATCKIKLAPSSVRALVQICTRAKPMHEHPRKSRLVPVVWQEGGIPDKITSWQNFVNSKNI